MKNKFALFTLLALFLGYSYNMNAQESDSIVNEEVVEETMVQEEETPIVNEANEEASTQAENNTAVLFEPPPEVSVNM